MQTIRVHYGGSKCNFDDHMYVTLHSSVCAKGLITRPRKIYKKVIYFVDRCFFAEGCLQRIGKYRSNRSRCHNPDLVMIWKKIP